VDRGQSTLHPPPLAGLSYGLAGPSAIFGLRRDRRNYLGAEFILRFSWRVLKTYILGNTLFGVILDHHKII